MCFAVARPCFARIVACAGALHRTSMCPLLATISILRFAVMRGFSMRIVLMRSVATRSVTMRLVVMRNVHMRVVVMRVACPTPRWRLSVALSSLDAARRAALPLLVCRPCAGSGAGRGRAAARWPSVTRLSLGGTQRVSKRAVLKVSVHTTYPRATV